MLQHQYTIRIVWISSTAQPWIREMYSQCQRKLWQAKLPGDNPLKIRVEYIRLDMCQQIQLDIRTSCSLPAAVSHHNTGSSLQNWIFTTPKNGTSPISLDDHTFRSQNGHTFGCHVASPSQKPSILGFNLQYPILGKA